MYQEELRCMYVSSYTLDTAEELSLKGRRYECLPYSKQALTSFLWARLSGQLSLLLFLLPLFFLNILVNKALQLNLYWLIFWPPRGSRNKLRTQNWHCHLLTLLANMLENSCLFKHPGDWSNISPSPVFTLFLAPFLASTSFWNKYLAMKMLNTPLCSFVRSGGKQCVYQSIFIANSCLLQVENMLLW